MSKYTLVTGGAGYIGTHTIINLVNDGFKVLIVDNFLNSSIKSINRVEDLLGEKLHIVEGDLRDKEFVSSIFQKFEIASVIHLAGLKSVSESAEKPIEYYANNISATVNLLQAMEDFGVFSLVFSSSATVYGEQELPPIGEDYKTQSPTSPYGKSKLYIEEILKDLCKADSRWSVGILRYFNPIGAHKSGLIGEDPKGIPNNLIPYVSQVAVGKLPEVQIFGNDYETRDGTGVRDYIHVVDLAEGHIKALKFIEKMPGVRIWNLGTGNGYSVMDVIKTFEKVTGRAIPYSFRSRREGDIAICFADPKKALKELGWQARFDLEEMIEDTWNWQLKNPNGYAKS